MDDFKSVYLAESEAEAKARLGLFVAKWSQTYPSFRKYLTEPGLFSFYRFPKAVWRPLYTSNAVEALHACLKRKLRARLALHSLKNGCCLIAVEAERCNRSGRNRRLTGFDELTADEVKPLEWRGRNSLMSEQEEGVEGLITQNSSVVSILLYKMYPPFIFRLKEAL